MSAPTGTDDGKQLPTTGPQAGTGDPQQPTDPQQPANGPAEPDYQAEAEKWKALARKHEATAKQNAAAAKELDTIRDAQKTAEQRLNDQLAAAQVELAQHRTREIRTSAAIQAGLPADMAEYLTEVEPEAVLEQAKRLAERLKPAGTGPGPASMPDARQGAVGAPARQGDDPNAWIRRLAGRA
jgi:hypothetical protein